MQTLTCLSRTFVRHGWSVQQLDMITALVRIVLASGSHKHTARAFVVLNSTGMYCHAYQKYTRSLQNTDTSIIRTHSNSPMVSPIEGFHCSYWPIRLQNDFRYSLNRSRNCCTCKLQCSVCGVLTFTFVYSSSRITYIIILSLEACTHPLSMFCFIPPDFGCCSLHLITVSYII